MDQSAMAVAHRSPSSANVSATRDVYPSVACAGAGVGVASSGGFSISLLSEFITFSAPFVCGAVGGDEGEEGEDAVMMASTGRG